MSCVKEIMNIHMPPWTGIYRHTHIHYHNFDNRQTNEIILHNKIGGGSTGTGLIFQECETIVCGVNNDQ